MGVASAIRNLGIRGMAKSTYYSLRHTGRPESLLLHSNVIADIDAETKFSINGRFQMGLNNPGASHPNHGRSVFTTLKGSSISHTGEHCAIVGPCSVIHVEGDLSIGDSRITSHVRLICGDKITIGDGVSISWDVTLLDDNRHDLKINGEKRQRREPIEIKDNAWIGHDSTISKGVTIGERAIVAENSVVIDDVPPDTVVAGNPAEPIMQGQIEAVH